MTINDLYPQDARRGPSYFDQSSYRGGPNDPSTWQLTPGQEQLQLAGQNADKLRQIREAGMLQSERAKQQFLNQFANPNMPVNLNAPPRNLQEAQLQQMVQRDVNARQSGVNLAPLWEKDAQQKEMDALKLQAARNANIGFQQNLYDTQANSARSAQDYARKVNVLQPQEDQRSALQNQLLQGQADTSTYQQEYRPFNDALQALSHGVSKQDVGNFFGPYLQDREKALLAAYGDQFAQDSQKKDLAAGIKSGLYGDPAQLNQANQMAGQYNQLQNQAQANYQKQLALRANLEDQQKNQPGLFQAGMGFIGSVNPMLPGNPQDFWNKIYDNSGQILNSLPQPNQVQKPNDYMANLLYNDRNAQKLIRQNPVTGGWESMFQGVQPIPGFNPQPPQINSSYGQGSGAGSPIQSLRNANGDYVISNRAQLQLVPNGAGFIGPDGIRRWK